MDPSENFDFYNWDASIISRPCVIPTYVSIFHIDTIEDKEFVPLGKFKDNITDFCKELRICKFQLFKCISFYKNHDVWGVDYKHEMEDKFFKLGTAAIKIRKEENVGMIEASNINSWKYFFRATETLIQKSGMYLDNWTNFNEIIKLRIKYAEDVDSKFSKMSDDFSELRRRIPPYEQSFLLHVINDMDKLEHEVDLLSHKLRRFEPVMTKVKSCVNAVKNSRNKLIKARKDFTELLKQLNLDKALSDEETA